MTPPANGTKTNASVQSSSVYTADDYHVREVDLYAAAKYDLLLKHLTLPPGARVLNVGCGSGEVNRLLAERGYVVDAIDPSVEAIRISQDVKVRHSLGRVQLFQATLDDFDGAGRYDAVFALDVVEHLPDDMVALAKIHALLRPQGRLFLSVPALPGLFGHHDRMLGHYRRYRKRDLLARLVPSFTVLHIRYFGLVLVPVAWLVSRVLQRPYPIRQSGGVAPIRVALRALMALEQHVRVPLGTSLLAVCDRRTDPAAART